MREMLGEVFRRSWNEDYTLLLRLVGIDHINTRFLLPEKGFPHSALMPGYVTGRSYGYTREEPQGARAGVDRKMARAIGEWVRALPVAG